MNKPTVQQMRAFWGLKPPGNPVIKFTKGDRHHLYDNVYSFEDPSVVTAETISLLEWLRGHK